MTDKTWKAAERKIAQFFQGRRRGADFRGANAGKTDIVAPGWSVEVKQSKRPTFGLMCSAVVQAENNRESPGDIPVAVIHKAGDRYEDSLVVMRLAEFADHFINRSEKRGSD